MWRGGNRQREGQLFFFGGGLASACAVLRTLTFHLSTAGGVSSLSHLMKTPRVLEKSSTGVGHFQPLNCQSFPRATTHTTRSQSPSLSREGLSTTT